MADFIVTNATTLTEDHVDVEIRDNQIHRIASAGEGDPEAFERDQRFDASGRLVTPPLVEIHTHLYSALTAGVGNWNQSGTLRESFEQWEQIQDSLTKEDYKHRAQKIIEWLLAHGVTNIRSHLGIENRSAIEAMLEIREECTPTVGIQLVAFPHAFARDETKLERLESLSDRVDAIGGMPHGEPTRELGVAHVESIVDIADYHDLPLDVHIDETDDPNSRFTEVLAVNAAERDIGAQTTASHATAMHSYPNAYADKLIRLLADSGLSVVTNPLANSVLQGQYDDYPRRRGHTRIDELRDAGVTVGIGQDDIMDTAYLYGDGDPLTAAFVLAHFAHMNGRDDVDALWEMLLHANPEIYGMDFTSNTLKEGSKGSLVVYDAVDPYDALRTRLPRSLVVVEGEPVVKNERNSTICLGEHEQGFSYSYNFK
jgi:cytosine deaminase